MQKICGTGKMCFFFKAGSGSGFKILICRIRIRPKMDRIRNPAVISLRTGKVGTVLHTFQQGQPGEGKTNGTPGH